MTMEIDFLQKKFVDSSPFDSDKMASELVQRFDNQAFTVGQQVLQAFTDIFKAPGNVSTGNSSTHCFHLFHCNLFFEARV